MSRFSRYIGSQFSNPRGIVGGVCCLLMNNINNKMYRGITDRLSGEREILDIGYGNGYLIEKIYQKTSAKIKGIDISEDMMKSASKRNAAGISRGDIELSIGDCCELGFKDGKFDAVTSVNTIYFWRDTLLGLSEIRRVLAGGGVFYNAVFTKKWLERTSYTRGIFRLYEREELVDLAKKAGFSKVETADIVKGRNYLVICAK